jgi:hypothetical protein
MPMVNMGLQDRETHKYLLITDLTQPADFFIGRTSQCLFFFVTVMCISLYL